ncbi:uncharacterized protein LOC127095068 [Lathyrus oleraceus]|uniref:uncharacterized protein LOC127095068 n=1 Tax=Pisum sativum TaxID=3888 RepID=UPI0021D0E94D|nr:uncharacterized protein LOC127095068 [Pisum sativum]
MVVSPMNGSMVIDTPTNGSGTISLVCLNCPLSIFCKHFGVDLICFLISQLDVILGMNWLEFNHVHINCFDKVVIFSKFEDDKDSRFIFANQVEMSLKQEDQVLMMLVSLKVDNEAEIVNLPVVCEFPDVFLDDIGDFPPDREVKFTIDLVPGTRPISMESYRMYASKLSELKKELEDLLEKKFVRPSAVSWGALVLLFTKKDENMRLYVDYR